MIQSLHRFVRHLSGGLCLIGMCVFPVAAAPADLEGGTPLTADSLAVAEDLQAQGKRREALRLLESLRATLHDSGDAARVARTAGALGKAYLLLAMPAEARREFEFLLAHARAQADPHLEAAALNDSGLLATLESRPQAAAEAFEAARHAAERADAPLLFSRSTLNLARQMLRDGKTPQALILLAEAFAWLGKAGDGEEKAMQLIAAGHLGMQTGNDGMLQGTFSALNEAANIARRLDLARVESLALGNLGELYARRGKTAEALSLARRALFLAQQVSAPDALYRWHWLIARLNARSGQSDPALASYEHALISLQAIRHDLIADLLTSRESYREAVGPLFQEYVDLLLQRAITVPDSERATFLLRARDTIEQLKTVELADYFQDACVSVQKEMRTSLDAIPPGTAVLYPILLPDRVELLLTLPNGIRQVPLGISGRQLADETERFRHLLEKRTTREFLPHARRLHDWLLAPIEEKLRESGIDTLVFVPDGPLRGLPLAALHDGRQFVIERYAVAVTPGLSLVAETGAAKGNRKSLLGGITEAVQDFPALPYVEPEVASFQSIYGGKAMTDAQFVIPAFEKEVKNANYSVIHIASHGQIESDPRKSFLLAYDGKITMDNLEDYMKYSRARADAIDLLTLSACRTAAGDDRAALGLTGVAVKAGARSALATLWYVNDLASSMLVTEFYRVLAAGGRSKAQALREAQRSVLADARYRHPGYWSPFLLIGNWR